MLQRWQKRRQYSTVQNSTVQYSTEQEISVASWVRIHV